MTGCLYCPKSERERRPSRVPEDVQKKCYENRNGTCLACDKLNKIERKIAEAHRTLKLLLDEKEALASVLNEHHDPITQRLPPEIVSRIFVHLKPNAPSEDIPGEIYDEEELIKAVMTPCHVCKDWRRIARSTPKLWTTLCITITKSNCITSVAMAHDWLERSGGLPLYLQISVTQWPNPLVLQITQKVIALAISHARRWEVMDLAAPSKTLTWMSEALSNTNIDRLSHIRTRFHNDHDRTFRDVLRLSASPHRLTQEYGHLSQISVNRERITDVLLATLHVKDAQILFQEAPHLLSCTCESLMPGDDEIASTVCAPSLRTFSTGDVWPDAWNYFQFPSLESLTVGYADGDDGDQYWTNLLALIRRSSCRIQELCIRENSYFENAIIEILKVTPDLERLSIEGEVLRGPLFSLLDAAITLSQSRESNPCLMGKVRSLSCTLHSRTYEWWALISFLGTMTSGPNKSLQSFNFCYRPTIAEDLKEDILKPLLDAVCGLEVKIEDIYGLDLLARACRQSNMQQKQG